MWCGGKGKANLKLSASWLTASIFDAYALSNAVCASPLLASPNSSQIRGQTLPDRVGYRGEGTADGDGQPKVSECESLPVPPAVMRLTTPNLRLLYHAGASSAAPFGTQRAVRQCSTLVLQCTPVWDCTAPLRPFASVSFFASIVSHSTASTVPLGMLVGGKSPWYSAWPLASVRWISVDRR